MVMITWYRTSCLASKPSARETLCDRSFRRAGISIRRVPFVKCDLLSIDMMVTRNGAIHKAGTRWVWRGRDPGAYITLMVMMRSMSPAIIFVRSIGRAILIMTHGEGRDDGGKRLPLSRGFSSSAGVRRPTITLYLMSLTRWEMVKQWCTWCQPFMMLISLYSTGVANMPLLYLQGLKLFSEWYGAARRLWIALNVASHLTKAADA